MPVSVSTGQIEAFLKVSTKESARRVTVCSGTSRSLSGLPRRFRPTAPSAHGGAIADADMWTDSSKSTAAQNTARPKPWTPPSSASLKPAELVVIKPQQPAGQIES